MFPNEYQLNEYRKELQRQANQQRLARQAAAPQISLTQRAGQRLLKYGARLAAAEQSACYSVESKEQVVTVCPA